MALLGSYELLEPLGAGPEVPFGDRLRPLGEARLVLHTRSLLSLTCGMRAVF